MKFVSNAGADRVLDLIHPWLKRNHKLNSMSESVARQVAANLEIKALLAARQQIAQSLQGINNEGY